MSVEKRPNGKWRARVIGPDGREHATHHVTKTLARKWEAEQRAARDRGQWIDTGSKLTVAEYARQWVAARPHRPSTARRTRSLVDRHIAGTNLGERRLASVRPSEVQAWATDRAVTLAPTTLRSLVGLIRSVFTSAVHDRLIAVSPVVRIKLPDYHPDRVVPLTVDQVYAIAAQLPDYMAALPIVQSGLGLRIGELLGLQVANVDFLRRVVNIVHQRSDVTGELAPPKTPRSKRTIPLPEVVAMALSGYLARFPTNDDGTIFVGPYGRRLTHNYLQQTFKAAAKRAGIDATPHDCRHAYASWLLAAGVDVVTVAERLGHENASMVIETYAHLMPNQDDRTRRAIDGAFTRTKDGPETSYTGADQ